MNKTNIQITARFEKDIRELHKINYRMLAKLAIRVKRIRIPTMIFEEEQRTAIIRTVQTHQNPGDNLSEPFSKVKRNFFDTVNRYSGQARLMWMLGKEQQHTMI